MDNERFESINQQMINELKEIDKKEDFKLNNNNHLNTTQSNKTEKTE